MNPEDLTYQMNYYISRKMKSAGEKKNKLLDGFYRVKMLSYDKGRRSGDYEIRDHLIEINDEIDQYYNMCRIFDLSSGGDKEGFMDILTFFDERDFNNSVLNEKIRLLEETVSRHEQLDHETISQGTSGKHNRKINIYAHDLKNDMALWKKNFDFFIAPGLNDFIKEVNDIVLFEEMNIIIGSLSADRDFLSGRGDSYQNFMKCIERYMGYRLKITRQVIQRVRMKDLIVNTMNEMGYLEIITGGRTINKDKFNAIIDKFISDFDTSPYEKEFKSPGSEEGISRGQSEQNWDYSQQMRALKNLLDNLCFIENVNIPSTWDSGKDVSNLTGSEHKRYLFHAPGSFSLSLRYIAENLRDTLIFIFDWVYRELLKNRELVDCFGVLLNIVHMAVDFNYHYKNALVIASRKGNQIETMLLSEEKHYISKTMAKELVQVMRDIIVSINDGLIEASFTALDSRKDLKVLSKKISIMQGSFNDMKKKILKGISGLKSL